MAKKKKSAAPARAHPNSDIRIIGVGSSAGGLEAIRELAANLHTDVGCAYVIVQHMSPQHKSLMTTLIASETELSVVDAADGQIPEPNVIYVTPPRTDIIFERGRLKLVEPSDDPAKPKPSVDRFLESLAAEKGEKSMGIILSGTGSDGAYGVQAIHEAGGITIAQDDASVKYDGMSNAAIETGCVDLVLRPSEIGTHLKKIISSAGDLEQFRNAQDVSTPLSGILQIVLARTRVDFREYKQTTVQRRIERRMTALRITQIEDYVTYCRNNPNEVDALFRDLLISVTRFFRDAEEFDALQRPLRDLVASRSDQPLRIWVAGCATGEEAYSIAIVVAEALGGPEALIKSRTQIFATDIDTDALAKARRGNYPSAAMFDVPNAFKERYFVQQREGVRVVEALRSAVLFSDHNLCQDPPFLNMDLICCRNVLIYFGSKLQSKVLSRLHYAMKPTGLLFLGTAESVSEADQLFAADSNANHIYRRRTAHRDANRFDMRSMSTHWGGARTNIKPALPAKREESPERQMFDALARMQAKNAVLVSPEFAFIRVYGDLSQYIDVSEGAPMDLQLSLLKSPLREEARSLTTLALKHGDRRKGSRHVWSGNTMLRLEAIPVTISSNGEATALLAFHTWEDDQPDGGAREAIAAGDLSAEYLRELDHELATTREALQQTIEELETSNEELQALNEELQSTNEELQATNEELETSNEELQSTNEELITVNEELQVNAAELMAINAELGSILGNVPMPLLVVDNALQVTRASGSAMELFSISSPLKSPHLSQIALPDGFPKLVEICNEALKLGETIYREFDAARETYTLQCAPFSGESGQLIGTTIVFTPVPTVRALTSEISELLEHAPLHLIRYAEDGTVLRLSQQTADILGVTVQESVGRKIDDLLRYSADPDAGESISRILSVRSQDTLIPLRANADAAPHWLAVARYQSIDKATGTASHILTGADVTKIVENEKETALQNRWLSITQNIAGIGYWHVDVTDQTLFWSENVFRIHGMSPDQPCPDLETAIDYYHPDDREMVTNVVSKAMENREDFHFHARLMRHSGDTIWVESRGEVLTGDDGEPTMVVGMFRDITDAMHERLMLAEVEEMMMTRQIAFFSFDRRTQRAYWSKNMWSTLGLDDDAIPGHMTFHDLVIPSQREDFIEMRKKALEEGVSKAGLFQIESPAHGLTNVRLRIMIGSAEAGEVVNYWGEVERIDADGDLIVADTTET